MTEQADPVHDVSVLIRSQYPIVFMETAEEERAEQVVLQAARSCGHEVYVWSVTRGMVDHEGRSAGADTKDVPKALSFIERAAPRSVFVMFDFHEHLADDVVRRTLRDLTRLDRQTVVVLSHSAKVPEELRVYSATYSLPLPDAATIAARIAAFVRQLVERDMLVSDLDEHQLVELANALRGLTMEEIDRVLSRLAYEDGRLDADDLERAVQAKADLLARGGVLELSAPRHGLDEVAGFDDLKGWIRSRGITFTVDAESLGLDRPKGFLLTGVPGCGKSFVVKALAREWNMPLLRLDAGALYDKYIGETERNLRSALATAEALAPSILWIDEIEKGFASTGPSSSDGGLGYRLVGTLLTWMQERTAQVFIAATSNNITVLPPELTRKGRFDEIFFVDLPDRGEREAVLRSQLSMRRVDPGPIDCALLADACEGFSGSEIEQAVVSALYSAHADGALLDTGGLRREIEGTRPLSVVSPDRIEAMRTWGREHARTA